MQQQSIEHVNQDMLLHRNYLQPGIEASASLPNSLTPNNLLKALKKRNQGFNRNTESEKVRLPDSLKQLNERIVIQVGQTNFQVESKETEDQITRQCKMDLHWENFTEENQPEYVSQHMEYLINKMVAAPMQKHETVQKMLKRNLFNMISNFEDEKQTMSMSVSKIRSAARIQDNQQPNRYKYHQHIKSAILTNKPLHQNIEQFVYLNGDISQIWLIISRHFTTFDDSKKSNRPNPKFDICLSSISMVESQISKQLPSLTNQLQISQYVRKRCFTQNRFQHFQTNQNGILVWGVPYILYQAGAWQNFCYFLNNNGQPGNQLRHYFTQFQSSIEQSEPERQPFTQSNIQDVFYEQLVSIVKGTLQYNPSLYKVGEINLIWLVLKTLKIYSFEEDYIQSQLNQIINGLLDYIKKNKEQYKNKYFGPLSQLLYLGAYKDFVQCASTTFKNGVTHDDWIHFLLLIYDRPEILQENQVKALEEKLKSEIGLYINNLLYIETSQSYVAYYILVLPTNLFEKIISEVFSQSWQKFNILNVFKIENQRGWDYIKYYYQNVLNQPEIFGNALKKLFQNLLKNQNKTEVIKSILKQGKKLFVQHQMYFDLVLSQICNLMMRFYDEKNMRITDANIQRENKKLKQLPFEFIKILQQCQQQHKNISKGRKQVIFFLNQYLLFEQLKNERKSIKLQSAIEKQQYISNIGFLLIEKQSNISILLKQLQSKDALLLLFIYYENIKQIMQRLSRMKGRPNEFNSFIQKNSKNFKKIADLHRQYNLQNFSDFYEQSLN